MGKKKKPWQLTPGDQLIRLCEKAIGYDKGVSCEAACQYLYPHDGYEARAKIHRLMVQINREHFVPKKGLLLRAVDGVKGWRYCLISVEWEARRADLRRSTMVGGLLRNMLFDEQVMQKFIPEPLAERLLTYEKSREPVAELFSQAPKLLPKAGSKVTCPHCQNQVPQDKFCLKCGGKLSA